MTINELANSIQHKLTAQHLPLAVQVSANLITINTPDTGDAILLLLHMHDTPVNNPDNWNLYVTGGVMSNTQAQTLANAINGANEVLEKLE